MSVVALFAFDLRLLSLAMDHVDVSSKIHCVAKCLATNVTIMCLSSMNALQYVTIQDEIETKNVTHFLTKMCFLTELGMAKILPH